MTVYVLLPVFNRLAMTQSMLQCLRAQQCDQELTLVVIDDGSTDGTAGYLKSQAGVTCLQGDGELWWGGAIDAGLRRVQEQAGDDDWVLFVNNDTLIGPHFIQGLLDCARANAPAAVGSVIRDVRAPHPLLSIGARIDPWAFTVRDALELTGTQDRDGFGALTVDALSGRGVLYPVAAIRAVAGMRPRWLPHYLADYELAARVHSAGWRLLVSQGVAVLSDEKYGNTYRLGSLRERLFSVRSPSYLPAQFRFWWSVSNGWQRLTLVFRAAAFALFPGLRKTE
jgi:GT2 family glycosyltransferase